MPNHAHTKSHFTAGAAVRDVMIGMADGPTVPFALAAGLTGAIAQTGLIITAALEPPQRGRVWKGVFAIARAIA